MTLIHADCLEAMAQIDAASVDAIVCDPPYGLEFMGKEWDKLGGGGDVRQRGDANFTQGDRRHGLVRHGYNVQWSKMQEWHLGWATAALRVLKPGGHLLAFGGTRTFHRLTCAIEDAGFEIRDCLSWLYGSGFPKSLDVSKAIDKAAGTEREIVGMRDTLTGRDKARNTFMASPREMAVTAAASDASRQWSGWGTALKPAWEPIILARKPLTGTVAANVQAHGTGALNVDGCRVGTDATTRISNAGTNGDGWRFGKAAHVNGSEAGRWPANVILDPEAARLLDEQSGERPPATSRTDTESRSEYFSTGGNAGTVYPDSGGASRFFYTAKASRGEREEGLEGREAKRTSGDFPAMVCNVCECRRVLNGQPTCGHADARREDGQPRTNHHPTVKPVALMRWLVRLVTPPGGTVLDPFMGSGTTGIAAKLEGFDFIGIEREAEYLAIAQRRIDNANSFALTEDTEEQPGLFSQMPLEGI